MIEYEDRAPKFLVKLLNILRSKENSKVISWDIAEKGIRIHNQSRLQQQLLPKYFRHNHITSFIRQLNMYDFHKINLPDHRTIFIHQVFDPRRKSSINLIKRKAATQGNGGEYKEKGQGCKVVKQDREEQGRRSEKGDQNHSDERQSFKLLFKSPTQRDQRKKQMEINTEQVLEEIIAQITPLGLSTDSIKDKIKELRRIKKFRNFLKRGSFLTRIYASLGIEMDESDKLSELSIEDQLLFDTHKSLTLRSLKMFDSGPVNLKDTLGMFLNS